MKFFTAAGRAALIIVIAVAILFGISFLPLDKWSGGKVKNFNLLSDILDIETNDSTATDSADRAGIDPYLLQLEEEARLGDTSTPVANDTPGLSSGDISYRDSVAEYVDRDTVVQPVKNNKVGNIVAIEDYTTGNVGMRNLRRAISSGRLARIAVVGDSYIEGDIFSQDIRANLQNAYGGEGVGYVNMHSDFPGFRQTVKQGGSGWKAFSAIKKGGNDAYYGISEQYFTPSGSALSTYKGVSKPHLSSWSRSRFLFIAPNNTTVSVRKSDGQWQDHNVQGSDAVQCIMVDGTTDSFEVKTSDPQLVGLGVWLDGTSGVSVDCMSSRGFSGVTLTKISSGLCRAMARDVNYDLIILEFGINAMSAGQKNYNVYCNSMVKVINHVRACYPGADILLLGIGDRGQKSGSQVRSMDAAPYMVSAQRDAARKAHCLFWDTREAMGGEDAVVEWSKQKLVNKDYIHLTHQGGKRLADLLFDALQLQLK